MKNTIKTLMSMGLMATSLSTFAQNAEHEQLVVRQVEQNLSVDMTPVKQSFLPDEAIKFNIKGNRDFFLYVFAVDEKNSNVTMMLPNKFQKGNKYTANQLHRVPNATEMELVSDRPGTEKIVMLASTKYLDWDTKGYAEAGRYMSTQQERFDSQLEALSVRPVQNDKVSDNSEMILREMMIKIDGEVPAPTNNALVIQLTDQQAQIAKPNKDNAQVIVLSTQQPADKKEQPKSETPVVFLSLDKAEYKAGNEAWIVYGADRPGHVHLILVDPKKNATEMAIQEVDGEQFYRLKAMTAKPKGKHKLIAAWTKDGKLDHTLIPELLKTDFQELEAFRLVDTDDMAYTVTQFKIK
ncbi:MAG: DUF4384 domain-containing protein [Marinicella sp.]